MKRRQYLAAGLSVPLLAGCLDGQTDNGDTTNAEPTDSTTSTEPGSPDSDGIYVQPFVENMLTAGTTASGEYEFGVFYTFPHQFWTVTGTERSEQPRSDDHSLHLMASVWDSETETVLPNTGLSVEITRDGDLVSEEVIYPMFSQRMGFHYGANFKLGDNGTYSVTVSIGGTDLRRTGSFEGRFEDPASATVDFDFTKEQRDKLTTQDIDAGGDPGAVEPMDMGMLPIGRAKDPADLPGTVLGSTTADGITYVVTSIGDERFGDETYVAVSARTRYNALLVPAMGLSGTITRDGETVYDGAFERTLDPELDYHYGALVDGVATGDELSLSVDVPPQVARHQGYETAFLDTPTVDMTL
ncbi:iron transporter [Halostella pelagica]|uniref:iron transporter n=1 Tax=Halostella pelagica TaxID=2583824 RepID=UPI001080F40B|nr:iron transporter [Halostella pelagica]